MQAQRTQPGEGSGAIGFTMPKHFHHSSQDSGPLSACGRASGLVVDRDLTAGDGHSLRRRPSKPPMTVRSAQETWTQRSNSSVDPTTLGKDANKRTGSESKEPTGIARLRSNTAETPTNESQKPLPTRLSRHNKAHSSDSHLTSLSTVSDSIPSPLPSPVTATTNSLVALSISQTTTQPGLSGRDLSKITVPREKKPRPHSISTIDSLPAQDQEGTSQSEDSRRNQTSRAPDPSSTKKQQERGPIRQGAKEGSKVASTSSAASPEVPETPTDDKDKSAGLKLGSLKQSVHLRVTLYNLVSTGYLPENTLVVFREHSAIVTANGTLIPQLKESDSAELYPWLQSEYETPSAWATAMVKGGRTGKVAVNGWSAIKVPIQQIPEQCKMLDIRDMTEVPLDALRKRYLADRTDEDPAQPEGAPSQEKGALTIDRRKRKRHVADSGKVTELRITTQFGAAGQKGAEITRPRKRTMSDLSGTATVTSDLLRDRQLHLEAAGALFSMKDPSSLLVQNFFGRRGTASKGARQKSLRHQHPLPLESLARYRQGQARLWSHSTHPRPSALRIVKELSLVPAAIPLSLSSSLDCMEFCLLCGASGEAVGARRQYSIQGTVGHPWPSTENTAPWSSTRYRQDLMKRCNDCGECFHLDCIPSDIAVDQPSSTQTDTLWCCPRCTICNCCQKMIHERPPPPAKQTIFSQRMPASESEEIKVLACDRCHRFTHVHCQAAMEPSIKDILRADGSNGSVEWICIPCRECVECGYRIPNEVDLTSGGLVPESSRSRGVIQGQWTHGSTLCPNCTALAEKGNICPVCCRTYEDDDYETPMIFCDGCSLWVHIECDKGLKDRDYEELGEDSKQYFCPSCVPTPIPSPSCSPSSSLPSANNSVEQSPWPGSHYHQLQRPDNMNDVVRGISMNVDDEGFQRGRKRKDDILDLIKAAKEISDSESHPYSSYGSVYTSSRSMTVSTSLESVAEVAAAEALMTIYSGASTPINSTPYTSYPPSPFESTYNSFYDRRYSVVSSPQDLPSLMRAMAFTPPSTSDQDSFTSTTRDCLGTTNCRCPRHRDGRHVDDYFNSRPRSKVYHGWQNHQITDTTMKLLSSKLATVEEAGGIVVDETGALGLSSQGRNSRGTNAPPSPVQPFPPQYRPIQESRSSDLSQALVPLQEVVDTRECVLCHSGSSSGPTSQSKGTVSLGRLLPVRWREETANDMSELSSNDHFNAGWIHSQCALWSTGVTKNSSSGILSNVAQAVSHGLDAICSACGRQGASIKCKAAAPSKDHERVHACTAIFHFPCVSQQQTPHAFPPKNAVIMDQKQRTILCSMHYREVSTLNDLRNAAFTLQSSAFPADSAVVKGSRPDTANESTIGALSLWQGPISIMDILLDQSHQLQPVREEMLNDTSLGDSDGAINTRQEGASFGFRIGSLVVHSVGSFEPPGPAYYETGLGNDMDLEIKYDAQLERGARIADHLKTTTKQQEVLALPFGYKCERRLRLDPHNSLCSVTAEIIRCRSVGHLGSKVPMDDNGSWTVAFGAKPENADQDQVRDDMEDNEVELSWKITITRLGGNNPGDREHSSVFYSDSMRDAVESIFQPPGKDTADGTATPPKQYGHYLRVPSAFFGLDHPVIRQTILSLSGEKAVSSRMWQRYRLNQRLAEQQCNDHGCFQLPTTTKTTTVSHAKGRQRSFEQQDSMSAARTRSRPLSRQLRKKVVRVGIAYGSRHEDGRAGVQDQSNPKSHKRGRSLVPGLSQDLTKTVITSPTSMLPLQSSKVASSPISTRSRSSKDPEIPDQAVTLEQFQKVRTEQSSNVTLYWNGRKMNITSITPTATTSTAKSKDSGISGLGHDEHLQANETDPKQQTLDTDMDIDQPVDRSMNASKTASSGGASRPLADMASLPVQAQTDLRIYAARAFEKDEMILEYVGELVSPAVALRRQESYQSHGRGYYMMWCEFQEAVIDATNQGGVARHIRHEERDVKDKTNGNGSDDSGGDLGSVYARTVAVPAGQNPKVVICASRRLKAGDELTMRYSS